MELSHSKLLAFALAVSFFLVAVGSILNPAQAEEALYAGGTRAALSATNDKKDANLAEGGNIISLKSSQIKPYAKPIKKTKQHRLYKEFLAQGRFSRVRAYHQVEPSDNEAVRAVAAPDGKRQFYTGSKRSGSTSVSFD